LDAERRRVPGLVQFVERNEPQLIAFNEYVNDDGTEVTVVQVHPDAISISLLPGATEMLIAACVPSNPSWNCADRTRALVSANPCS
jgi:hypothetical protein